jgi:hypothetical protein
MPGMNLKKCTYIVLSNAVDGQDDVYNDWYTNRHIVDVLKIPGVLSARRFRLTSLQRRDPPYPFRYLTIYEISDGDLKEVLAVLQQQSGTIAMPVSETFDPKHIALVFEPITDVCKPDSALSEKLR